MEVEWVFGLGSQAGQVDGPSDWIDGLASRAGTLEGRCHFRLGDAGILEKY